MPATEPAERQHVSLFHLIQGFDYGMQAMIRRRVEHRLQFGRVVDSEFFSFREGGKEMLVGLFQDIGKLDDFIDFVERDIQRQGKVGIIEKVNLSADSTVHDFIEKALVRRHYGVIFFSYTSQIQAVIHGVR